MSNVIRLIAFAAFAALIFLTFFISMSRLGLGFDGSTFPWGRFAVTCVAMLTGIFFGSLYRGLSKQEETVSISSEIKLVWKSVTFWKAMCVAPLVFMATYSAAGGLAGDLPSLLLAFQNGF